MITHRLEIRAKTPNRSLEGCAAQARDFLGVHVTSIDSVTVYKIAANDFGAAQKAVFEDSVLQEVHAKKTEYDFAEKPACVIEIGYRPGVTDNPARAAQEALALTGCRADVASGQVYFLFGTVTTQEAQKIASELLANDLLQTMDVYTYDDFIALPRFDDVKLPRTSIAHAPKAENISLLDLDDAALEQMSHDRYLALSLDEMRHIKNYFRQLGRNPTDVELEILAQSWSEHCKHKIFAADVHYTDQDGQTQTINSLYKTYIKQATKDIEAQRGIDWLISVFSDNAGVVRFDEALDVCIKVETHNSPSALDPYGGALTGILGVNRDILGVGLGAKPVANTDVFCFAPPDMPMRDEAPFMPQGVKPPRRILEGVHKGVEDGGNKSGIPTVNGAFFFDRDYAGKPLVYVGTVGVMPHRLPDGRAATQKYAQTGDRIYMVGGAIGADGIHGATFSSMEIDENAPATAVQIGDPLTQKRVTDFLLEARDLGLYSSITDNGAGGLSSSVGEMAEATNGAEIDLALCPVKYPGLSPWELMISESQERMTFAVPPEKKDAFDALAQKRSVSATDIGRFTDDGMLRVFYGADVVAEMALDFIHDSLPPMQIKAAYTGPKRRSPWSHSSEISPRTQPLPDTVTDALRALLRTPNITSKEKWVRAYDHEVQAATHIKPFTGAERDGPSDAGAIWLKPHGGGLENGIVVSCGLAPRLSQYDGYVMAQYAVDEAVRNAVAAGGDPDMICLLDNFCWPDPVESAKNPDGAYKMGQLVRTCQGLYDICLAYGAPLVSGKDSMKNDFRGKDKRGEQITISILPTLLVTALAQTTIGIAPGSDFKQAGDVIYVVGRQEGGLAGSEYESAFTLETISREGGSLAPGGNRSLPAQGRVPEITPEDNITLYRTLHQCMKNRLLRSIHDISEGGLLVAVAESCIGGRMGAELDCADDTEALFGEAAGRFVVSVAPDKKAAFETACPVFEKIGVVTDDDKLDVAGDVAELDDLVKAWKTGF